MVKRKRNSQRIAWGVLVAVAGIKSTVDYVIGVDSPFAKVCYHILPKDMKTNYQSDLAKNRKGVIERGGPNNLAKVIGFPYSLKYMEYRQNTGD